ncbi:MAG TPA: hypothetical protein VFC25_15735 [Verrucomicrobiae bacterium]|nr:hypothetical protein [Verrucomicrobiae bacterium]
MSTSVSAKSGLRVSTPLSSLVIAQPTSSPASPVVFESSRAYSLPWRASPYGLRVRPSPWSSLATPASNPARRMSGKRASSVVPVHRTSVRSRATVRWTLNPQASRPEAKRSVAAGIANSTVQPASSRWTCASQMPSQSADTSSGVLTSPS